MATSDVDRSVKGSEPGRPPVRSRATADPWAVATPSDFGVLARVIEVTALVAPGLVIRQQGTNVDLIWSLLAVAAVVALAIVVLQPGSVRLRLVAAASGVSAAALLSSAGLWPDVVAAIVLATPALLVVRRPAPRPTLPLVVVAIGSVSWVSNGLPRILPLFVILALLLDQCFVRFTAFRRLDRRVASGVHRALTRVVPTAMVAAVAIPLLYLPGALLPRRPRQGGWQPLQERGLDRVSVRPYATPPAEVVRTRAVRSVAACGVVVAVLAGWWWTGRESVRPTQAFVVGPSVPGVTAPPPTVASPSSPSERGHDQALDPDRTIDPRATNTDLRIRYSDLSVFDDAPWANDLQQEEYDAGSGRAGRYVNVSDGVRRTRQSDCIGCPSVTLWLLGGSFAFGMGQRDDHTIASELVRLAEREGVALRVVNLSQSGATIHELDEVLAERLERRTAPDLVVFIDGYNDVAAGLSRAAVEGFSDAPIVIDDRIQTAYLQRPVSVGPLGGPDAVADHVARRYAATQDRILRRVDGSGVPVRFFFQPDGFRNPVQLQDFARLLSIPPELIAGSEMARTLDAAARRLEPRTVNLRPVFDTVTEPVFFGTVHTNERGAEITAASIWGHLGREVHDVAGKDEAGGR